MQHINIDLLLFVSLNFYMLLYCYKLILSVALAHNSSQRELRCGAVLDLVILSDNKAYPLEAKVPFAGHT